MGAQAEQIIVSLDTYLDRRTAYTFGVTASGVRLDWYHPADRETVVETAFDPVWVARDQRDSLGWTAEMRIPYSQLRFNLAAQNTWGLNVAASSPRERGSYWVMMPPRAPGWASRFGDLGGLAGDPPGAPRGADAVRAASGADCTADPGEGNPFDDGSEFSTAGGRRRQAGAGAQPHPGGHREPGLRAGGGRPRRGQPDAFEIFFAERRPFFTEAGQLLAGNGPAYFYSRRIGAAPRETVVANVLGATGPEDGYAFWDAPAPAPSWGPPSCPGGWPPAPR